MNELSVAIIARDKFSRGVQSITSLVGQLPPKSMVYLFDSGYPGTMLRQITELSETRGIPLQIITVSTFANVNEVWNEFLGIAASRYFMGLENDVTLNPDCIDRSLNCLKVTGCDIAVPVVYENTKKMLGIPHFNPRRSSIVQLPSGARQSFLERGRDEAVPMPIPRRVSHLERHCFFITDGAARRLGTLDEQMYCRTDYDMSLQCHVANLSIMISDSSVVFTQYPDLGIDREFFDFRWNLDKVAFANSRLISKWKLEGFKTTIDHAHAAREELEVGK